MYGGPDWAFPAEVDGAPNVVLLLLVRFCCFFAGPSKCSPPLLDGLMEEGEGMTSTMSPMPMPMANECDRVCVRAWMRKRGGWRVKRRVGIRFVGWRLRLVGPVWSTLFWMRGASASVSGAACLPAFFAAPAVPVLSLNEASRWCFLSGGGKMRWRAMSRLRCSPGDWSPPVAAGSLNRPLGRSRLCAMWRLSRAIADNAPGPTVHAPSSTADLQGQGQDQDGLDER